jgi:hypothetical protein
MVPVLGAPMGEMQMKKIIACAALASALALATAATPALAASDAPAVLATVHTFLDDFNKGDIAGVKATHVAAPVIIDEPPPHLWTGSGAIDGWIGDLTKSMKSDGDTNGRVRTGAVSASSVEGDVAYVHIVADFLYREHHKAMDEPGGFTFALTKAGGSWKIAAWSWNGSKPHVVAAAAKPAAPAAAAPAAKPKT